mmetsp:Transcript_100970/g.175302  ORF Transcript_100970/g.175302 Transcript_100970/m.175302 type:complete len:216 (+) Transcript_100970:328-975(+)
MRTSGEGKIAHCAPAALQRFETLLARLGVRLCSSGVTMKRTERFDAGLASPIKCKVASIMATSLDVSPQTKLGPSATPRPSCLLRPSTPLPLLKDGLPSANLGNISMSVPVSCMSNSEPIGSISLMTCWISALKRRLSSAETLPPGSFRAMVSSPNLCWRPDPRPRNLEFSGLEQSNTNRSHTSCSSVRTFAGRGSTSSTCPALESKYSRPFDPA